jgi:hypothetical protein
VHPNFILILVDGLWYDDVGRNNNFSWNGKYPEVPKMSFQLNIFSEANP